MKLPKKPPAYGLEFRIIDKDEIITCLCGKKATINGMSVHSRICDKSNISVELYAEQKRNGLAKGRRISFSKYYATEEEANNAYKRWKRIIDKKASKKKCISCGKIFFNKGAKTCSKKCAYVQAVAARDQKTTTAKAVQTRILRGSYQNTVPWNKNIKGDEYLKHYCKEGETLDDAKSYLTKNRFVKTSIEIAIEKELINLAIPFKYNAFVNRRSYDFKLLNTNILIEADGDYWHGNILLFPNLSDRQLMKQKDDRMKDNNAKEYNYIVLRFWENYIRNNPANISRIIKELINGNTEVLCEVEKNYTSGGSEYVRCYRAR